MTLVKPAAARNATSIDEIEALAGLRGAQKAKFWRECAVKCVEAGADITEYGLAMLFARIEKRHAAA